MRRSVSIQTHALAADNAEALGKATPEIPPGFPNRQRANCVPAAGDQRSVRLRLEGGRPESCIGIEVVANSFDPSTGVQLLHAIKKRSRHGARTASWSEAQTAQRLTAG